jgi:hypothetical protein
MNDDFIKKLDTMPYGMLCVSAHSGNVCRFNDRHSDYLSVCILRHDEYFVAD